MQKCLLDMDGVIANWVGATCLDLGVRNPYEYDPDNCNGRWDIFRLLGRTEAEEDAYYASINNYEFWRDLEPMPEAHEIVDTLCEYFGRHNVCILSSPGHMEMSMPGKVMWLRKHFPYFAENANFMFGKGKHFCAHPDAVLIDDFDKNVEAFREHNGKAFLVPRPWNADYAQEPNLIQTLKNFLETL